MSWKYLQCIYENHAHIRFTTHSWKKLWDRSSRARNYTLWLLTLLTHTLLWVSVSSLSFGTGINANPEATESPNWISDSCCQPTRPSGSNGDLAAACSWSPMTAAATQCILPDVRWHIWLQLGSLWSSLSPRSDTQSKVSLLQRHKTTTNHRSGCPEVCH